MSDPALAGMVYLRAASGPFRFTGVVITLSEPPALSGGVGGWQGTDRPGRRPARWWQGGVELTQTITGFLDLGVGPHAGTPVERRLLDLRRLGVKPAGEDEPPPIALSGDVVDPYSAGPGLWVMQGLSLGDRLFRRGGVLQRQAVTVELVDYEDTPTIAPVRVKRTRDSVAKPRTRQVSTRKGDTLRTIAVRELGSASAWDRIRGWNPRVLKGTQPVGPDDPLRPGVRLVLK